MSSDRKSNLEGKPLQIIELHGNNKQFKLNQKNLEAVLLHPKVKDKPIAVVSICGDFRKGKSFMLNILIRYFNWVEKNGDESLRMLKNFPNIVNDLKTQFEVPKWFGNSNEPLSGFNWKPGVNRQTAGIWMWSEPFVVPLKPIQVSFKS